ncbi:MAG TPA: dienelactone hydrolase family protein [Aliidongia sp.]|nr:dienelactone hydrolase family protein [Aliidongia sp.]
MRQDIRIKTPDGIANASIFRPEPQGSPGGGKPATSAILFYMDAVGPRPSLFAMAQRLANAGYLVLLPDLFYRFSPYGASLGTSFADTMRMLGATTQEMSRRDTGAFIDFLAAEGFADSIGAVGYCMGGSRALAAAASHADRVKAAASFHGGDLASDAPDSPHLLASRIKGRVYVGVAETDSYFPPEQSGRLALALRSAGVDHIIETYAGTHHGWTMSDFGIYDEAGAERHWKRLLTFFDETLT